MLFRLMHEDGHVGLLVLALDQQVEVIRHEAVGDNCNAPRSCMIENLLTNEIDVGIFEIDPMAEAMAIDTRYYCFLDRIGSDARVVLGDARLSLARSPDREMLPFRRRQCRATGDCGKVFVSFRVTF